MIKGPKIPQTAEPVCFASGVETAGGGVVSVRWYRSSRQRNRRADWVQVSVAGNGTTTSFSGENLPRAGAAYRAAIEEAVARGVVFTGVYSDPLRGR